MWLQNDGIIKRRLYLVFGVILLENAIGRCVVFKCTWDVWQDCILHKYLLFLILCWRRLISCFLYLSIYLHLRANTPLSPLFPSFCHWQVYPICIINDGIEWQGMIKWGSVLNFKSIQLTTKASTCQVVCILKYLEVTRCDLAVTRY